MIALEELSGIAYRKGKLSSLDYNTESEHLLSNVIEHVFPVRANSDWHSKEEI